MQFGLYSGHETEKEWSENIIQGQEFQRGRNVESIFGALHDGTMPRNVDILADPDQNMHNILYIPENHFQSTCLYQKTEKKQC